MQDQALVSHLQSRQITSAEWVSTLEERKRQELEFHDHHRDRAASNDAVDQDTYEKLYGNKKYYAATTASHQYVDDWIRCNARDKIFLDYACGNGFNAIAAAQAGARLSIGLDISPVSVENATKDAEAAGISEKTFFIQADAENTGLPAASVDTVICSGMLHHLDLSYAFPELRRILAPGGKILAVEALDYNPLIKLYRHMTPGMRTEWEKAHILSMADVRFAERFFTVSEIRFWHLASILGTFAPAALPILNGVDAVLTRLPLVKYLAWIFTFELGKPK